jgi:hypothetical protein
VNRRRWDLVVGYLIVTILILIATNWVVVEWWWPWSEIRPDFEPPTERDSLLSDDDLIDRLRDIGAALASGDDLQPPMRLRHSHTIDQVIRRIRQTEEKAGA